MKRTSHIHPTTNKGAQRLAAASAQTFWVIGVLCVGGLLSSVGCRGRAQEDIYRQSLQREVRQLEDQLYEADYENRILIEKLRRDRVTNSEANNFGEIGISESGRVAHPSASDPGYVPAQSSEFPLDDTLGSQNNASGSTTKSNRQRAASDRDKLLPNQSRETIPARPKTSEDAGSSDEDELPDMDSLIDPGELVDPNDLVDPGTLDDPGTLQNASPKPKTDSSAKPRKESDSGPGFQLLPPPGGPVPPGTPDLEIEPIDPGVPMPPGSLDGESGEDPGKIKLPGVSMLGGLGPVAGATPMIKLRPAKIHIDAASTKVRMSAEEDAKLRNPSGGDEVSVGTPAVVTQGVDLSIRADDQYGHPIAVLGRTHDPTETLRSPDAVKPRPLPTKARLTIIALDPTKTGDDAQLGRWDFDTEKLQQLETSSLANHASGYAISVPIRWQERVPHGEAVVFFARFESGERDLRCESEIGLKKQPSVAGWLPRR